MTIHHRLLLLNFLLLVPSIFVVVTTAITRRPTSSTARIYHSRSNNNNNNKQAVVQKIPTFIRCRHNTNNKKNEIQQQQQQLQQHLGRTQLHRNNGWLSTTSRQWNNYRIQRGRLFLSTSYSSSSSSIISSSLSSTESKRHNQVSALQPWYSDPSIIRNRKVIQSIHPTNSRFIITTRKGAILHQTIRTKKEATEISNNTTITSTAANNSPLSSVTEEIVEPIVMTVTDVNTILLPLLDRNSDRTYRTSIEEIFMEEQQKQQQQKNTSATDHYSLIQLIVWVGNYNTTDYWLIQINHPTDDEEQIFQQNIFNALIHNNNNNNQQ